MVALVRSPVSMPAHVALHAVLVELLVCVYDERRDVYFEIHPERDFALDIYYHPYAHVGYGDGALAA